MGADDDWGAGQNSQAPSSEEVHARRLNLAPTATNDRRFRRPGATKMAASAAAIGVALVAVGLVFNLRLSPPAVPPASATPAISSIAITKADAVAAVQRFLGRALGAVEVGEPQSWPGGREIEVRETDPNGAIAWVDVATGRVIRLELPAPETATVAITADQALAAAEAFFKAHNIPIDGLTATVKLEDHGCCRLYSIEWDRIENGVVLPDSRLAQVDPSNGTVFSFMDRRVSYGAVPSPKIGHDEAIRLAIATTGLSDPKVESIQLIVDSGPVWTGQLVWSVQLSTLGPEGVVEAAWIEVDAITGETMVAGLG
jgi:hypothetical protein